MAQNEYGLNEKQLAFCDYYLKNNTAGLSYQMAYDPDGTRDLKTGSCYTNGSRLLKNEKVQNYLNVRMGEMKSERLMSAEEILVEITQLSRDPSIKPSERIKALELLGRHKALFSDKVQMDSQVQFEINLTGIETDDRELIVEHVPEKIEENTE